MTFSNNPGSLWQHMIKARYFRENTAVIRASFSFYKKVDGHSIEQLRHYTLLVLKFLIIILCVSEYTGGIEVQLYSFFNTGARWGAWSSRPGCFTPGKDPVPIVQEDGWVPGPVWRGAKNHHRDSIPRPSSQQRVAIPTALGSIPKVFQGFKFYRPQENQVDISWIITINTPVSARAFNSPQSQNTND